jgi:hypothetical protein
MHLLRPWLLLSLALPTWAQGLAPDEPIEGPGEELAFELELRAGEHLLDYAWDRQAAVPFLRLDPIVRVPYGERGLHRDQRLYLPFNSRREDSLTGARTRVWQASFDEGRFGQGLELGPSSYVHVDLAPANATAPGWSLQLWIRPEAPVGARTLLTLDGAATLWLQADGRLLAELEGGGSLTSARAPTSGAWSFVDLSYDARQTGQLRLSVDAASARLVLEPNAAPRVPDALKLGDLGRSGHGFVGALDEVVVATHPLSTARAEELASPLPTAGSHRLRWTTNLGWRSAAPAAGTIRANELDDALDFAQGELVATAVVDGELVWTPGHWRRLETLGAPAPRTTHALVALGGGRVLTFGGETRDTHLWPMVNTDDTWILDGGSRTWELVATPEAPSPRCHIPLAYSPDHDLVLLHGGWRNDRTPGEVYGDTWVFHLRARRWERRSPTGSPPGRLSDFGLVYVPSRRQFLMLSGRRAWFYDPQMDRWEARPQPAAFAEDGRPASYVFASSTLTALDPRTEEVLVFGGSFGASSSQYVDTTALYDVATNAYTVIDRPVRPSRRARSGFAFDPSLGLFVLFGGVEDQYSQRKDDLWTFDPATREWTRLLASNTPSPRGGYYGMAYDERADRFVLALGRASYDRWLDDTWELTLDPRRTGTALYTFDRQGAGPPGRWFADVVAPGASRVHFFFRTGHDGAHWSRWRPAIGNARGRFVQVAALLVPAPGGAGPRVRRMGFR